MRLVIGMRPMNCYELSWEELNELSTDGKLGPHNLIEAALLVTRRKPVWFATEEEAKTFTEAFGGMGFVYSVVPKLVEREDCYLKFGVYHQDNPEAFERLVSAWDIHEGPVHGIRVSETTMDFDLALGSALGYREVDLARFIVHNLSREQFMDWKKSKRRPHGKEEAVNS